MARRSRKIAKRSPGATTPALAQSDRRDGFSLHHQTAALELVEELLDAHLDTIEMMSERQSISDTELGHVRYLKALYRHGRATSAAFADGPGPTITRA